jgi:hypothetical protein
MLSTRELIRWLRTLPDDSRVYIDEGGLILKCLEDQEAYMELGGEPMDTEEPMDIEGLHPSGQRWTQGYRSIEADEPNTNENCLDGMRCPKCGSLGPYLIDSDSTFEVEDMGTDTFGGVEWDEHSPCECKECEFRGLVGDFENDGKGSQEAQDEQ